MTKRSDKRAVERAPEGVRPPRLARPLVTSGGPPLHEAMPGTANCPGCLVRAETIEFLRDQLRQAQITNEKMQEKLLSLAGDAADKYHKIQLTNMANQNMSPANGVVGLEDVTSYEQDDRALDAFMDSFIGGKQ